MPGYVVKQLGCLRPRPKTGFRLRGFILQACLAGWGLALLIGPAGAAAPAGKLLVAATIVPLGDFCQKIGGDLVQVQVLIPPGASPHAFEPPPSVMARASQARVFVYIGAGLEPWADKLLRSRGGDGLVVVEAAQGVPLLKDTHQHHHEEAEKPGHTGRHHEAEESADLQPGRQSSHLAGPGAGPGYLPEDRQRLHPGGPRPPGPI